MLVHEVNIYRVGKYVNEAQYSYDFPSVLFLLGRNCF